MAIRRKSPIGWIFSGNLATPGDRSRKAGLRNRASCEALEGRVVLSGFGGAEFTGWGNLQGGPAMMAGQSGRGPRGRGMGQAPVQSTGITTSTTPTPLQTDMTKLQTDTKAVAAKSGVTIADLTTLRADEKSIQSAGASLDRTALDKAVSDLTAAIVGGTDTSTAKTEFNALFTGTTVSQATIDKAFADVSQVVTDSKITTADLSTIAADKAAFKADKATAQVTTTAATATTATATSTGTISSTGTSTDATTSGIRAQSINARALAARTGSPISGRVIHGRVHASGHRARR